MRLLESLSRFLERQEGFEVLGRFDSAEAALRSTCWENANVLISDLELPGLSGIDLIRRAKESWPDLLPLAYTLYEDRDTVFAALKAGAFGYLLKGCAATDLVASIQQVVAGESPISPAIARRLLDRFLEIPLDNESTTLSEREISILRQVSEGLLYKEVADKLAISRHTVHTHIKRIYSKLHAADRAQALRRAKMLGYLD